MDIESLKEAIGDEKFTELQTYVNDLTGQRDQARNESISGRKSLKEKVASLETQHTELLEKLGLDSFEDIDDLVTSGAAEATKQAETKINRLQRQLDESSARGDGWEKKYRDTSKQTALAKAFRGHEFVADDVVESFVSDRLTWEGEDLLFKTDEGNLVPVADGVSSFAKARPELLKAQGTGGAGVRRSNAGGTNGQKTMDRAEFEALPVQERMEASKSGVILQ